jgi:2-oxo-3-hexenedioate decarboxylase
VSPADKRPFDPRPAAERFAKAWREDLLLQDLPSHEQPATMEEGYEIQRLLAQGLGESILGYKLGLSSPNAMRASGLGRPITGFIPQSRFHTSGAVVPIRKGERLLIEVEIALALAHDILPGQRADNVSEYVHGAYASVELVRSHFVDRRTVDLPTYVGDGAGFHGLVLGSPLALEDVPRLSEMQACLRHNGSIVASNASADDCPDPFSALRLFLEMAAERGDTLKAGAIIATGNVIVPFESHEPGTYEATLGGASVGFELRRA